MKLAYFLGRRARPRAVQLAVYSFYCSQQSEKKGWGKGLQLVRLELGRKGFLLWLSLESRAHRARALGLCSLAELDARSRADLRRDGRPDGRAAAQCGARGRVGVNVLKLNSSALACFVLR